MMSAAQTLDEQRPRISLLWDELLRISLSDVVVRAHIDWHTRSRGVPRDEMLLALAIALSKQSAELLDQCTRLMAFQPAPPIVLSGADAAGIRRLIDDDAGSARIVVDRDGEKAKLRAQLRQVKSREVRYRFAFFFGLAVSFLWWFCSWMYSR